MQHLTTTLLVATLATLGPQAPAQDAPPPTPDPSGLVIPFGDSDGGFPGLGAERHPQVEIPWNRLVGLDELYARMDRLAERWPTLLSFEVIGHSVEGRELRVYTLNDPASGPAATKPAMWVDGNIHGNEVQGGEAVVYLAWYLLENQGHNARVDDLLGRAAFYLLPSVNPDGRAHWFEEANNGSSSRSGVQPEDDDLDGLFDEDPANDLDGDGQLTQMRKYVPGEGTHRLDPDDPRLLLPVAENDRGLKGDWVLLGSEGIDDDGDGRVNEDGLGGYDMNRAWPSSWMPEHVQRGAGPYPLYWPETRAIAAFILAHPNLAAVQSFHNNGGMILRGPGAEDFGEYPREDLRVYDQVGAEGEKMLPFYRYMVIWKDLYTVWGGFVNWTYEGLGIISFTNELWTSDRISPDDRYAQDSAGRHWTDDHLLMGAGFVDWHPYDHPVYGPVEIGGFRKDVGRVPPSFLIEEMLHRNAMFCILHAEAMPDVAIDEPEVTDLGDGLFAVDVTFRNLRPISTRTGRARETRSGAPDVFALEATGGRAEVVAAGWRQDRWRPERLDLVGRHPERVVSDAGIPGRGEVTLRWFVRGSGSARVSWTGEKGIDVSLDLNVR